jgi:hypothetical protein
MPNIKRREIPAYFERAHQAAIPLVDLSRGDLVRTAMEKRKHQQKRGYDLVGLAMHFLRPGRSTFLADAPDSGQVRCVRRPKTGGLDRRKT